MSDVNNSIAAALASLTTALTALAIETARSRGFASALEDRIAALEARAVNQDNNAPAGPTTTEILRARQLTTFQRAAELGAGIDARPVRDGQW
jgi:hypothetical protein